MWSVKCRVFSAECKVYSFKLECRAGGAESRVESVECAPCNLMDQGEK